MLIKIFVVVALWTCSVLAFNYTCNEKSALRLLKRPSYDFSIKLLQRVARDADFHFVYSPLGTWLQLSALAEGATDNTLREIKAVTKHHRHKCFMRKLKHIIYKLDKNLNSEGKRKSIMILDSLMDIKKSYVKDVENLFGIKVMELNFGNPVNAAEKVNSVVTKVTDGIIDEIVYYDDFKSTVLLMSDASYFKSEWWSPFDSANSKVLPFYSNDKLGNGLLGHVRMMNQVGNFNVTYFPKIKATVLELPCANRRLSMLVFLPDRGLFPSEIFYKLQKTRLTSIFNIYKHMRTHFLVNVTLPRFKIRTEIENLPELLYDMGIKKIFDPKTAELTGISNYKMFVSMITQIADIEVTEKGIIATSIAHSLGYKKGSVDFNANRPFVYMIVDKLTEFILYAGIYSVPSLY